MTKADIVEAVKNKMGFSQQMTAGLVEDLFEIMKDTLAKGEDVKISGFGKFEVRQKNSRPGRNPRTGQDITISARKVVAFKPSQLLRETVNKEQS